ncbi:7-carboxy-7-deazaguanine synthase QueE [Solilutibacter silvestris]|uniref:7-carboxy-7-deazaguanine synthase n=1 Tax=Solilutibacter silvestris TaxID=1645665 RepID=A0A2K1Q2U0_9GAMM|nr:7-carboxy-7-deazaguanine synthase QueE [Lysobacter silvestris]PNS09359.1 putative 7-cyano-7-deazaguanosine (preQ0) biosynthesis protein QueE [Lysobacter silvestris]
MNAVVATAIEPSSEPTSERLRITEIFLSLQGEARDAGWPTVFVRLTGCPLRCLYCDTAYAFHGGEWVGIDDIVATVAGHGVRHVCVTGGEPLSQKRCIQLLKKLCDEGWIVSLETSGAIDIGDVDARVSRVVDIKTPGSGEVERNRWENIALLTAHDQVKFVICSREDFDWARAVVKEHALDTRCDVLFSPSHGQITPRELADWIVAEHLPVRFQMQLHKQLWGEEPGR